MAGPGRAPKATLSRPNDQARRDAASTKVSVDGVVRGPDLPGDDWPAQTRSWWENLRRSPMAQAWITADWDTLLDTALLHREMWNGDLKLAPEIRLRMSQFGANPESRLRLRLQVDADANAAAGAQPPTPIDDARRKRVLRSVSGSA